MSLDVVFRPLKEWPCEMTKERKSSAFRASYTQTLDLLEDELFFLDARNITIYIALGSADIRNDGLPRLSAKPSHPGVILSFERKNGRDYSPVSMPCDTFNDWKSNLRGIALSLQALRAVDRYGVTKRGEQYKGFDALPSGSSQPDEMSEVERAAFFIAFNLGMSSKELLMTDQVCFQRSYREAAKKLHPDSGGTQALFVQLQQAKEILERHFANR